LKIEREERCKSEMESRANWQCRRHEECAQFRGRISSSIDRSIESGEPRKANVGFDKIEDEISVKRQDVATWEDRAG